MALGLKSWSTTASSNGNASSAINFQEGQAPSTLNDSNRALMAEVRAWTLGLGGAVTHGGSADAYTVTNVAAGVWSAYADGDMITICPAATNTGASTVNVDGLGTKAIRTADGGALVAGDLVLGGLYLLAYEATAGYFIVLSTLGGGDFQLRSANLTTYSGITPSANVQSLLAAANYAAMKALLDLEIGVDVQAWSANLDEYAAVNPTAAGLALLDDADNTAQRTTLGLGSIATQAASSVSITGGSITGITDLAVADGGTGASSASAARTSLGAVNVAGDTMTGDLLLLAAPSTLAANSVGFRGLGATNGQGGDYTVVLGDVGRAVLHNPGSGTHTYTIVPAATTAWPDGAVHSFANMSGTLQVTGGTGVTFFYMDADGTAATETAGTFTVPIGGRCFLHYISSNNWLVSGDFTA